jgi:hypothetical protein
MLERCLKSLRRFELDITVVDNTGQMGEWWHDVKVVKGDNRYRQLSAWETGLIPANGPYIVCDEDIEIDPGCPWDLVPRLMDASSLYLKVGLQIRTDDIPEIERYAYSLQWERSLNARRVARMAIIPAEVDTHFAIYRSPYNPGICGVRLAEPYQVRHLPWYNVEYTEEEIDYYRRTGPGWALTHSAGELCES